MATLILLAKIALALYIVKTVFKSLAWLLAGSLFSAAIVKAKKAPAKTQTEEQATLQALKEFDQALKSFK